tara:strand:- start:144 stop:494 length:351 start_codon:yes stop_codon:yes gene_type:complete
MRFDIYDVIEKNLGSKPTWFKKAACKGAPIEMFFLERGCSQFDSQPARKLCATCSVRPECLEYAITEPEDYCRGIWGGTTAAERRKLRQKIRALKKDGLKTNKKISVIDLIATDSS